MGDPKIFIGAPQILLETHMSSLRTLEFSLRCPKISFETQIKSSMKIWGYPMNILESLIKNWEGGSLTIICRLQ